MLTYVGIILGFVCLIAIAVGGYMIYSRMQIQSIELQKISTRQMKLEGIISRPPPKQEILSLFEKVKTPKCEDVDCDIRPIRVVPKNDNNNNDHTVVEVADDGGDLKRFSEPPSC